MSIDETENLKFVDNENMGLNNIYSDKKKLSTLNNVTCNKQTTQASEIPIKMESCNLPIVTVKTSVRTTFHHLISLVPATNTQLSYTFTSILFTQIPFVFIQ